MRKSPFSFSAAAFLSSAKRHPWRRTRLQTTLQLAKTRLGYALSFFFLHYVILPCISVWTQKHCPFSNDYARQHIVCVNQTRVVFKKLAPNTTNRTNVVGYLHANSTTKRVDVSGFAEGSGAGSQLVDSNEIFCIAGVDKKRFIATADGHSVGVDERGILVVKVNAIRARE